MRPTASGRATGLLAGAFLLGLAALAQWPRWGSDAPTRPALTAIVLDASASAHRPRPGWIPFVRGELAREAELARAAGHDVLVVAFGLETRVLFGPGPPAELEARLAGRAGAPLDPRLARGEDQGSDLARALERVQGPLAETARPPGRLVLISDGRASGRDPRPLLGALRVGQARYVPLPRPERFDLALAALEIEPVPEGAPQVAALELELDGPPELAPATAVLAIEIERPGGREQRRVEVSAPEPGRALRLGLPLGPAEAGATRVRVRVEAPDGRPDPFPENDERTAFAFVGPGRAVALVAAEGTREQAAAFWDAGAAPAGLDGRWLLPGELAGALAEVDLVVTFDVPRSALPEAALARWIEGGGGLLAFDGAAFADLETRSPLARWWPLVPAPPDRPPRDVVLIVDTSGSMAGAPFEGVRAAVLELADAVPPGDRLWMHFFTGRLFDAIPLGVAGSEGQRARLAEELLRLRTPRGATAILASMESFAALRAGSDRAALVFLLTDGREEGDPPRPVERAAELVERFAAQGTELIAVAMGTDRVLETLENLTPGRVREWSEGADLAAILREEAAREGRRDGRFPVAVRGGEAGSLAEALADSGAPGAVARLARTRVREGGEAHLAEAGGAREVVLAVGRAGAGRIARAAGGPLAGWAEPGDWRAGDLGALLTFLADRPQSGARVRWVGETLEVTGLPEGLPALLAGRWFDPLRGAAGEPFELAMPAVGPAQPTRVRVGRPPEVHPGAAWPLWLELFGPGGERLLEPLAVPREPGAEFAGRRARWNLGAGDLPTPSPAPAARAAPHPLAPWLLLAALAALVLGALSGTSERPLRRVKAPMQAVR